MNALETAQPTVNSSTANTQRAVEAVTPAQLARSYAHCHKVAKHQARNFYYGMKLTPTDKRNAMYAVYAWMRLADDLADEAGSLAEKTSQLNSFAQQTWAALDEHAPPPDGPIWPAMRDTMIRHAVPHAYLADMIAGQLLDQKQTQYDTFAQLDDYCYKVAGTVGLVCITIWGHKDGETAQQLAAARGVALQLTNILRDLAEDARLDRCYLPREDFTRFGFSPEKLARGEADAAFDRFMAFQVDRARSYYEKSAGLDALISPDCRACSRALMRVYRDLLEKIARNPRQVLHRRVSLNHWRKAWIALSAVMGKNK